MGDPGHRPDYFTHQHKHLRDVVETIAQHGDENDPPDIPTHNNPVHETSEVTNQEQKEV